MRVAVDARWCAPSRCGGVGRGTLNVLQHLDDRVDLDLLLGDDDPDLPVRGTAHRLRVPRGSAAAHLQWSVARWLRGYEGLFHGPFYAVPATASIPTTVALWDVTFETRPEWFGPVAGRVFRTQARWAARHAHVVFCPSQATAAQVQRLYGVPDERLCVVPLAVDPVFRRHDEAELVAVRERWTLVTGRKRYVLALDGAPRRGAPTALATWERLTRTDADLGLVVVGKGDAAMPEGAVRVERLDEQTWAATLSAAELLLYPTQDEGFGLPALEAAASGTPVVAAPVASLPEVLGEAAAWSDGLSPAALAEAARPLLDSPVRRQALQDAGLDQVAGSPGWPEIARSYEAAWHRVAHQHPAARKWS